MTKQAGCQYAVRRVLCGLFCLFIVFPAVAFAQSTVSVNLSPIIIEEKVVPGESRDLSLSVENRGDTEMSLTPFARNIIGMDVNRLPIYATKPEENTFDLASWITFKESRIVLPPGGRGVLNFTVQFPENARPGSHMAGLFVSQAAPEDIKLGSGVGFEVASILHFQMTGDIVEDTRIREFSAERFVYGTPDVTMRIVVKNLGNTFSRPQGLIDITDMFGKKVGMLPVNKEGSGVFPGDQREYLVTWKPEGLTLGRFDAALALAVPLVDGGNQTISGMTQFWVLPMKILGPVLGGLLVFIVVFYVLLKLYIRKQLGELRGGRVIYREVHGGVSRLTAVVIALLVALVLGLVLLFLLA